MENDQDTFHDPVDDGQQAAATAAQQANPVLPIPESAADPRENVQRKYQDLMKMRS